MKNLLLLATFIAFCFFAQAQLIAFPGAEGFGKYSTGGRGGKVVEVTTLEDSVMGSLRWALDQYVDTFYVYKDDANPTVQITSYQPLTVVFKVSGIIDLKSDLKIKRDNLTIAGQTSPCGGICIKSHSVLLNGATGSQLFYWGPRRKNVILRYLRFRPGIPLDTAGKPTSSYVTYGLDVENYENVIVDHCSISWANEECLATYDTKNITFQWNIVSEGLYNASHPKGVRAYGGVWGGQFATYHHNLLAHQNSRTPRYNGSRAHDTLALVDYRNNVNYNWLTSSAPYGGEVEINGGFSRINIINNYYKPGPATPSTQKIARPDYTLSNRIVSMWHVEGNIIAGNTTRTNDNWQAVDFANIPTASKDSAKSDSVFAVGVFIDTKTAQQAYDSVLAYVGAIYPERDTVDRRIINEVKNKTASVIGPSSGKGGIIDDPANVGGWPGYLQCNANDDSDHDGMPDSWETDNGLNPDNEEDRNIIDPISGYTMLEVYLNNLAAGYKPVPLKILSFSGTAANGHAQLSWIAANDISSKGWYIERTCSNAEQWQSIGFIACNKENAGGTFQYNFTDPSFSGTSCQYRLKQIDIGGHITYSNIIRINAIPDKKIQMTVSPNPTPGNLYIQYSLPGNGNVCIDIFNSKGQLAGRLLNEYSRKGVYQKWLSLSNLPDGNYIIRLQANGEIISKHLNIIR